MNDQDYDALADIYTATWQPNEFYNENYRYFKQKIYDLELTFVVEIAKLLRPSIATGKQLSVLDLGCGNGKLTLDLLDQLGNCYTYFGIDVNLMILADHKLHLSKPGKCAKYELVCKNMNSFSAPSKIDIVVSLNSLYSCHIANIIGISRLLNKNGVFVTLMNSKRGAFSRLRKMDHFRMSSAEDLETVLKQNGVKFVSIELSQQISLSSRWWNYLCREDQLQSKKDIAHEGQILEVERAIIISGQNVQIG